MSKFKNYLLNMGKTIKMLVRVAPLFFCIMICLNVIAGASVSVGLYVWKCFIDSATYVINRDMSRVKMAVIMICLYLLIQMVQQIINDLGLYIQTIYGEYIDRFVTESCLRKIETLQIEDFENTENFDIIQKASEDSLSRTMSLLSTLIQIVKSCSSIIGTIVLLAVFSPLIVIICLISTIPVFFVTNKIHEKWYEVFSNRYEKLRFAHFLKSICIRYENIKEFKVFKSNEFLRDKILNIYDNNIKQDKKVRKKFMFQTSSMNSLGLFITYIAKGLVIFLVYIRRQTMGSLLAYLQAVDVMKNAVNTTMDMVSMTYEDSLYIENLFLLLEIKNKGKKEQLEKISSIDIIEFQDVSFKYSGTDKYAVKNFSYTFYKGKSYGIVGLNGSGKTTFLKMLMGLYQINKGNIKVNHIDINLIDKDDYAKLISAIFQDFIKYPLDVRANVSLADYTKSYSDEEIKTALDYSDMGKFVEGLPNGIYTKLQKEWSDSVEMSLGQWQKIAVSRSILKESQLLILDEPTASLDPVVEYKIFASVRELVNNRMLFMVSHRLKNVRHLDEILVMDEGMLKEKGTFDSLMNMGGLYFEWYQMQENESLNEGV